MNKENGTLTPKQERFVQEYLVDVNATQAAIRAGYSKKTATEQASRLLTNVKVSEAIAKGQQARAEKTGVTAEKVIAELALIAFASMGDYLNLSDPEKPTIDLSNLTPAQAPVIAEVTYEKRGIERRVKIKLHDKLNALVSLGKHFGLFSDKFLLGGIGGGDVKHVHSMTVEFVKSERSQ